MKGVIFTEFIDFIETNHGLEMVDLVFSNCDLESGGAYTSVATYDVNELVQMIGELSRQTKVPPSEIIIEYGRHLFRYFARTRTSMMSHLSSCEDLLASVENQIHVDVRKLYPDAELPSIRFEKLSDLQFKVHYQSARPLADLAEGLILESIKHFGDPISVLRNNLPPSDGTVAEFILTRQA